MSRPDSLDGLGLDDAYAGDFNLKVGDVIYLSRQVKLKDEKYSIYMLTQGVSKTSLEYEVLEGFSTT